MLLQNDQHLLSSYQVKSDAHKLDLDELENIVKQKPNKAIIRLGNHRLIRFHLWFYNFADIGKPRKYKNWLKSVIGEEPILLDTALTGKSSRQLYLFLLKKGYFDAKVIDTTKLRNRQSWITYTIKSGKPYLFTDYKIDVSDSALLRIVLNDTIHSLIRKGENYDESILELERERITKIIRNSGYYNFSKEYLHYIADSNQSRRRVAVVLSIDNPETKLPGSDSIVEGTHSKYTINRVFIETDFQAKKRNRIYSDSTQYGEFVFLHDKPLSIRERTIIRPFFLHSGELFKQENIDETYKLMANLKLFRNINVQMLETNDSVPRRLDAFVQLSPAPKQAFSVSAEGTYNSGNFGISGNLIFQNKNVFKGAEIFEIRMKGGFEVQNISNDDNSNDGLAKSFNPFNIFQIGPEVSLNIPRIIFPLSDKILHRNLKPKTSLALSYNYQRRPEYLGTIANFSYNYNWRPHNSKYVRLTFTPSEINFVKVFLDPDFRTKLESSGNPVSIKRYDPLFINSIQFNLVYNNQDLASGRNFSYFRFDCETGGNLPTLYNNLVGTEKSADGSYEKFGIKYAEYWKTNVDYRFYHKTGALSKVVARTFLGFGQPYGNSKVLPFVKSFYGGGVNDMRAWKTRRLGPGALPNELESKVDQTGDMKIEFNLEYRYNVY